MNEQIHTITTALELIESRLKEPVTVADIAAAAGYSLYHFIRTFNRIVQHTPYDYLMRRRLSLAAQELLESERRVIDIALDFQFNNHETFTRAFGRILGKSPTRWREAGYCDARYLMPVLDLEYLEFLTAPGFENPQFVELEEIILTGLMAPLTADSNIIPDLWQDLRKALGREPSKKIPSNCWGFRTQTQISERLSYYLASVRIPSLESAPSTFVTKIVPAGNYVRFPLRKSAPDVELALKYLYHTFLPNSGILFADPIEIEHFGEEHSVIIPVQ